MKFAFAAIRSHSTELTGATAGIPIQTLKKPTVSSVSAKHSKKPKLLTVSVVLQRGYVLINAQTGHVKSPQNHMYDYATYQELVPVCRVDFW